MTMTNEVKKTLRLFPGVNQANVPPRPTIKVAALSGLGGFFAIAAVAGLSNGLALPLILGSFGASCMILFGLPDSPLAQPRNTIFGHLICSFMGLFFLSLFPDFWWSLPMAVGLSMATMMVTRTVHPPAVSNPVIVFLTKPAWGFLFMPTLAGAVILVLVAYLYNNFVRKIHYPRYW